jgi:quercetin dioxygenase-like cupin family protein
MDVRSIVNVEPVMEHAGTAPVWWIYKPHEMFEATIGGYLELVSQSEVQGGGKVNPHKHPIHEFYYMLQGKGIVQVGDETREVSQGDLIHIPPNKVHSIWPISKNAPINLFIFAIGLKDTPEIDYTT